MFKKQKKTTVHELIQQLKALDAFEIDIYEAQIEIRNKSIKVEGKEKTAHLYIDDDMFGSIVNIYTHK
jgi:hypothetical protein